MYGLAASKIIKNRVGINGQLSQWREVKGWGSPRIGYCPKVT